MLAHTTFVSGEWKPDHGAEKVLNLHLAAGEHTLRFVRPWSPGLPYLRRFYLEPARDAAGMVRLVPRKDYMVFRRGEPFPMQLQAGRLATAYDIHLALVDPETNRTARQWTVAVPAGEGMLDTAIGIPTDEAGVFDLHVRDAAGRPMDRSVQFVVIDTQPHPACEGPKELKKSWSRRSTARGRILITGPVPRGWSTRRLVRIANQRPGAFWTTTASRFVCLYAAAARDPGAVPGRDRLPGRRPADVSIALIEQAASPYARTQGVASGGVYSLSGQMQPHELFFYPRKKNRDCSSRIGVPASGPRWRGFASIALWATCRA